MNNGIKENEKINLYYYFDRELSLEEKEWLRLLEEKATVCVVKTESSFWQSEIEQCCNRKDKKNPENLEKNFCIGDCVDVLRCAQNAGWAVIACRDSIFEEQERRGADTYFVSYAVEDLSVVDREYLETVYCRSHQLPRLIADTERLLIREMASGDLDDLMEVFDSNDKTDFFEAFYDGREDAREFLDAYIRDVYRFYDYGIWGIYLKESGKMIGIVGFTPREGTGNKNILELGYGISKEFQNRGYAKEACRAVMKYAEGNMEYTKIIKITEAGIKETNR